MLQGDPSFARDERRQEQRVSAPNFRGPLRKNYKQLPFFCFPMSILADMIIAWRVPRSLGENHWDHAKLLL